jgi:hypothetical protein
MRIRDRYRGLVWIAYVEGDPAEGRVTPLREVAVPLHVALAELLGRFGLLVEMEHDVDVSRVRCFPRKWVPGVRSSYPAASYTGGNLGSILAAALADYDRLDQDGLAVELSPKEVVRWVA